MYFVYYILNEGIVRYVGITNDIKKREYQHNYECFVKQKDKTLYNLLRKQPKQSINLNLYKRFNKKSDAELYEAYIILKDYFGAKELWQAPPKNIRYY
jgi:predicted GIY-YIG superfamily endonuclease